MNLFEIVKASVSAPEAVRAYGLDVTRHNMVRCPFHDDRHPSLKLNPDFYYCFGCGARGDVIDLVAGMFDLSTYEAARKIAADFGIDTDKPPEAAALAAFLAEQTTEVTDYDEVLVRQLIEKITVYDDLLAFEFKSGLETEVQM